MPSGSRDVEDLLAERPSIDLTVSAQAGFLDKLAYAIELLRGELPPCCQTHLHAAPKKTG